MERVRDGVEAILQPLCNQCDPRAWVALASIVDLTELARLHKVCSPRSGNGPFAKLRKPEGPNSPAVESSQLQSPQVSLLGRGAPLLRSPLHLSVKQDHQLHVMIHALTCFDMQNPAPPT